MRHLIQQLNSTSAIIKEDGEVCGGAVGAGAVAGVQLPLFATALKRSIPTKPKLIQYSATISKKKKKKGELGIREAFYTISEDFSSHPSRGGDTFDANDAISKLKSLEDKESVDYRDTATFGLVDNNGGIVRVTVPQDQAQGFEQDIQHFLGDRDEAEPAPEIAEVLFNMKDRYTIVNVEWPAIEEDQEEGQELEGGDGEPGSEEGGLPTDGEELPGADAGMPMGGPTGGAGDVSQVQDLLTQVIDMMKADADARKSEAQAREAEANTRQAGAARDHAMARVKQEEQFLDMDSYEKNQKAKDKEAKRLAQLAKWKHQMTSGEGGNSPAQEPQYDFLPGEEENEEVFKHPQTINTQPAKVQPMRGKVSSSDIARFIANRIK